MPPTASSAARAPSGRQNRAARQILGALDTRRPDTQRPDTQRPRHTALAPLAPDEPENAEWNGQA